MRQTIKNLQEELRHTRSASYEAQRQIEELRKENQKLRTQIQSQFLENGRDRALRDSAMRILRLMCQSFGEMTEQIEHIR